MAESTATVAYQIDIPKADAVFRGEFYSVEKEFSLLYTCLNLKSEKWYMLIKIVASAFTWGAVINGISIIVYGVEKRKNSIYPKYILYILCLSKA